MHCVVLSGRVPQPGLGREHIVEALDVVLHDYLTALNVLAAGIQRYSLHVVDIDLIAPAGVHIAELGLQVGTVADAFHWVTLESFTDRRQSLVLRYGRVDL